MVEISWYIYIYIYIDNGVYKQTYNVRGPHIVWHLQDFFHWLDHHDWIMPASILFYQQHPTLLGTCTNKSGDMKEHTVFYHWNHVNLICFQRPVICTDGFWLVVWNLFFYVSIYWEWWSQLTKIDKLVAGPLHGYRVIQLQSVKTY